MSVVVYIVAAEVVFAILGQSFAPSAATAATRLNTITFGLETDVCVGIAVTTATISILEAIGSA